MTVYIYKDGAMVDKETGEPMNSGPWKPTVPMIMSDIEPYQSPVDGSYVGGRRSKRYDLEKHDCIDAGDMKTMSGKFKNKRFAKKRGLKIADEYQ